MNKLDSKYQSLTVSTAVQSGHSIRSGQRPEPAHCLIVLVPSLEIDLVTTTHRLWELANATGMRVQFLGLYSDPAQEPRLRRELVTMAAMVKDDKVSAEANAIFGKDWIDDVVKIHFQPGDMVVCFAEQRTGLSRKPLIQVLQSLEIPLYILPGLYPRANSRSNWAAQIAAWMGSIAIIIGFFVLQVKIDQLVKDWAHITLWLLSISFEIWIVWVWNNLFEQYNQK